MYHYDDMVMLCSAAMYTCGFDSKPAAVGRKGDSKDVGLHR